MPDHVNQQEGVGRPSSHTRRFIYLALSHGAGYVVERVGASLTAHYGAQEEDFDT